MSEKPNAFPQEEESSQRIENFHLPTELTADFEKNPGLKEVLDDRLKELWAERALVMKSSSSPKVPSSPEIEMLERVIKHGVVHLKDIKDGFSGEILAAYSNVARIIDENSTR
jgi:hypothetical protein